MFLEWWMILILIVVTGVWSEWRALSSSVASYKQGINVGGELVTTFLIAQNYLKVDIDGAEAKPVRWPPEDKLSLEKVAEFVRARGGVEFEVDPRT